MRAYADIESEANSLLGALRLPPPDDNLDAVEDRTSACLVLVTELHEPSEVYPAVRALSDAELDRLIVWLTAISFGQHDCESPDAEASLFNVVAAELDVDMSAWWRPDTVFLQGRSKPQLAVIAREAGAAISKPESRKKAELVELLAKHFATERAQDWLPGAMRFPAVVRGGEEEERAPALAAE